MKIAITGGIGSGKSYVCRLLAERGIEVYNCDSAAKMLMATSPSIIDELTRLMGPDTYIDGKLNKAHVAQYLLSSDKARNSINAIVHPAVAHHFIKSGMQWMECAILYEAGFDKLVDKVVAVAAPEHIRLQRVMTRDGISQQKAIQWMAQQMPQHLLCAKADYVITNDGQADICRQLDNLMNTLGI